MHVLIYSIVKKKYQELKNEIENKSNYMMTSQKHTVPT